MKFRMAAQNFYWLRMPFLSLEDEMMYLEDVEALYEEVLQQVSNSLNFVRNEIL